MESATTKRSALEEAAHAQFQRREARAETTSSLLFCGAIILAFGIISLSGEAQRFGSFTAMRTVFLCFMGLLLGLAAAIRAGFWHPVLRYVNSALQVAALGMMTVVLGRERGALFVLSTAIPMLYCLVITLTAFRLSPWLSLFTGTLAAASLVATYGLFLRPAITPEVLAANPTIAWPAVWARVVVLLATGAACALAARTLRNQFRQSARDQGRIQLLERTFGRMVAPEVAQRVLEDENWMKPARREAVIMFADLKGFTRYSDGKTPEEVADFLNRCWTVAADIVEKHRGVINKYMGDGFLAMFGAPMELDDAEKAAAQTAQDLQRGLAPLLEPAGLALCIGVHAGPLIAGGIGSASRYEYTVIGSTVNLASRLETLNRSLETRCLASEHVARKIAEDWDLKDRGGQHVKGVANQVSVFEILGRRNDD